MITNALRIILERTKIIFTIYQFVGANVAAENGVDPVPAGELHWSAVKSRENCHG